MAGSPSSAASATASASAGPSSVASIPERRASAGLGLSLDPGLERRLNLTGLGLGGPLGLGFGEVGGPAEEVFRPECEADLDSVSMAKAFSSTNEAQ